MYECTTPAEANSNSSPSTANSLVKPQNFTSNATKKPNNFTAEGIGGFQTTRKPGKPDLIQTSVGHDTQSTVKATTTASRITRRPTPTASRGTAKPARVTTTPPPLTTKPTRGMATNSPMTAKPSRVTTTPLPVTATSSRGATTRPMTAKPSRVTTTPPPVTATPSRGATTRPMTAMPSRVTTTPPPVTATSSRGATTRPMTAKPSRVTTTPPPVTATSSRGATTRPMTAKPSRVTTTPPPVTATSSRGATTRPMTAKPSRVTTTPPPVTATPSRGATTRPTTATPSRVMTTPSYGTATLTRMTMSPSRVTTMIIQPTVNVFLGARPTAGAIAKPELKPEEFVIRPQDKDPLEVALFGLHSGSLFENNQYTKTPMGKIFPAANPKIGRKVAGHTAITDGVYGTKSSNIRYSLSDTEMDELNIKRRENGKLPSAESNEILKIVVQLKIQRMSNSSVFYPFTKEKIFYVDIGGHKKGVLRFNYPFSLNE
ncbi:hypothetical protein GHT06_008916 [Daphnia sinensis]|uniref:Uncharacterized protein n=1 Tax=Daphnia sinensis TaxID=1820382 RepID=A0AAD5PZB9_9CRUS|nr:hypothetical protein GHT06_008916 [Daphnia sinensis]